MKKFIGLFTLLLLAGFMANLLWAGADNRAYSASRNIKGNKGAQLTQNDKNQVADKLSGEGDVGKGEYKDKIFPKAPLDHKVKISKAGKKGFHKGEKGFLKLDIKKGEQGKKGFLKGQKGFIKGEKGKPNEIDDEVTWSKNKGLDAKSPKGKGFIKFDGTGKAQGAGNQMPAVK